MVESIGKVAILLIIAAATLALFLAIEPVVVTEPEPEKVYGCIGFQEGEKLLAYERHVFDKSVMLRGRSKDGAGSWHDVAIPKSGLKGCLHVPGLEMK